MRNTKILNVRIPTELHEQLTKRAAESDESLAWATRYTLRVGFRGVPPAQTSIVDLPIGPPAPQPKRAAPKLAERFRVAKPKAKARKGGK